MSPCLFLIIEHTGFNYFIIGNQNSPLTKSKKAQVVFVVCMALVIFPFYILPCCFYTWLPSLTLVKQAQSVIPKAPEKCFKVEE